MPNMQLENYRVPREKGKDKRIKLTPQHRQEIRDNAENLSHNALAAKYGVSKRLVQFIRSPDKYRENLLRRKEKGGTMQYYSKEKQREYIAIHRQHKRNLMKESTA